MSSRLAASGQQRASGHLAPVSPSRAGRAGTRICTWLARLQNINAPVGEWDWSRLTDFGQIFSGVEIGKNWTRGKCDFDHAHLDLWYGDEVDTAPYPTESGWGLTFSTSGS
jgi:hypothetical protein